jgi:hypothetical protein
MRQSWVALAVAYQMSGDLEKADKVLTSYKSMLKVSVLALWIKFNSISSICYLEHSGLRLRTLRVTFVSLAYYGKSWQA